MFPQKSIGGPTRVMRMQLEDSIREGSMIVPYLLYSRDLISGDNLKAILDSTEDIKEPQRRIFSLAQELLPQNIFEVCKSVRDSFVQENLVKKTNSIVLDEIELIHNHSQINPFFYREVPTVLTIHTKGSYTNDMAGVLKDRSIIFDYYNSNREANTIAKSNVITFPSNSSYELFLSQYKGIVNSSKVQIVYNGIDIGFIDSVPSKKAYSRIRLICVANHVYQKQIDRILTIFSKLQSEEKYELFLVGSGILLDNHKQKAFDLGIANSVFFLSNINNVEVVSLLKSADIFILLAKDVVMDLALLEAMASDLLIIVSNDGGNREVIENGVDGFLISKSEDDKVIDIIKDYSSNPNKYEGQKKNARRKIINQFTTTAMMASYRYIYEQLI